MRVHTNGRCRVAACCLLGVLLAFVALPVHGWAEEQGEVQIVEDQPAKERPADDPSVEDSPEGLQPISIVSAQVTVPAQDYMFNGEPQCPEPVVTLSSTDGDIVLAQGVDYWLSYQNNINAGAATVTAHGCGAYQDEVSAAFAIERVPIEKAQSAVAAQTYSGRAHTPKVTLWYHGVELSEETDYEVVGYENNVGPGTASISVAGKGSYTGKKSIPFVITKSANGISARAGNMRKVSASKVQRRNRTVASGIRCRGQQGELSYRRMGGSDALSVDSASGRITVRKGTKQGTYKVRIKVTAAGDATHDAGSVTVTCKVKVAGKMLNPLQVQGRTKTVSAKRLAAQSVSVGCPLKVTGAKGEVTYEKASGSRELLVDAKTGKVTVAKGAKKGTYRIRIRVCTAGNHRYKRGTRTVTGEVVVR